MYMYLMPSALYSRMWLTHSDLHMKITEIPVFLECGFTYNTVICTYHCVYAFLYNTCASMLVWQSICYI